MILGQIKTIKEEKNFGFINYKEGRDIYFSLSADILNQLSVNDEVVFEKVMMDDGRDRTVKVRKIVRDATGRIFVMNWKSNWLKVDLQRFLPFISDEIDFSLETFKVQQFDFKEAIGNTDLVEANEGEVFYAIREGRMGYSRLIKGREAKKSNSLVLSMRPIYDNMIEVVSCYVGVLSHPEPFSRHATNECLIFWRTHALRSENMVYDESTVQFDCPW